MSSASPSRRWSSARYLPALSYSQSRTRQGNVLLYVVVVKVGECLCTWPTARRAGRTSLVRALRTELWIVAGS